jgi:hypothetical protein
MEGAAGLDSHRLSRDAGVAGNARLLHPIGPSMRRPVRVKTILVFLKWVFGSEPSRLCRHPSIRTLFERFSLGASWVSSFQSLRASGPRKLMKITKGKIATARSGEIEPPLAKSRLCFSLIRSVRV